MSWAQKPRAMRAVVCITHPQARLGGASKPPLQRCCTFGRSPGVESRRPSVSVRLRNFDWPEGLLLGCSGVVADSEALSLATACEACERLTGLGWSEDDGPALLNVGGVRQRVWWFLSEMAEQGKGPLAGSGEEADELVDELVDAVAKEAVSLFVSRVEDGTTLESRPGIERLIREALESGTQVAFTSSDEEVAVRALLSAALPADLTGLPVFAYAPGEPGKPSPAVILRAMLRLDVSPARCVCVEDSRAGVLAARAAGARVIATKTSLTASHNFDICDAELDSLGWEDDWDQVTMNDLTTPGTFWLNPPMPMDAEGFWIRDGAAGDGVFRKVQGRNTFRVPGDEEGGGLTEEGAGGLTQAELDILMDMDPPS